jgi:hypothetical protein
MYLSPNSSNPFSWVSNGLLEVKGACTVAIISCEGSGRREAQERKNVFGSRRRAEGNSTGRLQK